MGWSADLYPASSWWDIRMNGGGGAHEPHTIGIDLGKTAFIGVGLQRARRGCGSKKFSRKQTVHFTANLKVDWMAWKACGGAHFLGRLARAG